MHLTYFSILFLFFITLLQGEAQKVWKLEDCIDHAVKNNLQLKQAENSIQISNQTLLQSRALQLPSLNANGNHNYNFGRNIDPFTNQFTNSRVQSNNFSLTSSLLLFNGNQLRNTITQSRYDYLASSFQMETLKNDISLAIAAAFLDILFTQELLANAERQLSLSKDQYLTTEKLVKAGTLPPNAMFDIASQVASEEATVERNRNTLSLSYLSLAQLLDLPSEEIMVVELPSTSLIMVDSASFASSEKEVVDYALSNQPQIKLMEYRKLRTLEALQVERGRMSPRLSLNASMNTIYSSSAQQFIGVGPSVTQLIGFTENSLEPVLAVVNPRIFENKSFSNQFRDNYSRFIGLSLTVPILNGFQVRTSIHRAKYSSDNAALELKRTQLEMEKTVRRSYADARASLSNYKASLKAVNAFQESFRNVERRAEVGLSNTFDYLQAKTRLTNAQSDLLRAKYDYVFKLKIVDFYSGSPLKL